MYKVDLEQKQLIPLDALSYASLGLKERFDIQEWIEKTPQILGEELLIIAKEYELPSRCRLDLLAIDKNAQLVIIELKRDDIKAKTRNNVVQEKKYFDRLKETLRKYHNRGIETAQVIEELIKMAEDFKAAMAREAELGLHPDEVAFYDALASNASAVRELGDETLKKIAVEITEKLRKSTTVDWQVRDSVRATLRILVRRTLQRYKYPPDKAPEAIEMVLKQAEVLSGSWSR